nr:MAG TPA: hypothetical protein [Bacteriophage sp.]
MSCLIFSLNPTFVFVSSEQPVSFVLSEFITYILFVNGASLLTIPCFL